MTANDDFFGGGTPPPPAQGASGVNPHLAMNKEYASFAPAGGPPPPVQPRTNALPIVMGVAALVVALVGWFGYQAMFASPIELPDTLLGYERVDPDSDEGRAIESSWSQLESVADEDIDLHVGGYTSGSRMLLVVAGEAGTKDNADVEEFFAGMTEGMQTQLPGVSLREADAGDPGGTMECFEVAQANINAGGCAWVAAETFGVVLAVPLDADIAQTTRDVRAVIEK